MKIKEKVLLIEDERTIRGFMQAILTANGYDVLMAGTGAMANTMISSHCPDLIILDGGKPQLSAALEMFDRMGIDDIAMCGLAKRDEELFVPWQDTGPVVLPSGSASLYLVKQVRDEAHRFAITFHRELRGKGMTASILDDVVGMGPVRKKALLKHFKNVRSVRAASLDELMEAVPKNTALAVYRHFHPEDGG